MTQIKNDVNSWKVSVSEAYPERHTARSSITSGQRNSVSFQTMKNVHESETHPMEKDTQEYVSNQSKCDNPNEIVNLEQPTKDCDGESITTHMKDPPNGSITKQNKGEELLIMNY